MNVEYNKMIEDLNHEDVNVRLESLRKLMQMVGNGEIETPVKGNDVNNHIHTSFSFSPYSPTKAVWMAYNAGLITAGIIDHDSIGGAEEFIEAGKIVGMPTTIGVECRADFSKTVLNGRRINNPDQSSVAYVTMHGIPHTMIDKVHAFFVPYVAERNKRNKLMIGRINKLLEAANISLDFERDAIPLSQFRNGGSITERHILYALSFKLVEAFGKGGKLVDFLKNSLAMHISVKTEAYLMDSANCVYEYDLLGALKSDLVEKFYIDAEAECPDIREFIDLANSIGAIAAYAYLGDVGDSVTGDKKTQKFEDDFIDLLFELLKDLGFHGVTYMPSRNSMEQLRRVKGLCDRYGLFQISGEDINSPRQKFICEAMKNEEFGNLIDSTWALIGHEKAATEAITKGMFSKETVMKYPDLKDRIEVFKKIGMK